MATTHPAGGSRKPTRHSGHPANTEGVDGHRRLPPQRHRPAGDSRRCFRPRRSSCVPVAHQRLAGSPRSRGQRNRNPRPPGVLPAQSAQVEPPQSYGDGRAAEDPAGHKEGSRPGGASHRIERLTSLSSGPSGIEEHVRDNLDIQVINLKPDSVKIGADRTFDAPVVVGTTAPPLGRGSVGDLRPVQPLPPIASSLLHPWFDPRRLVPWSKIGGDVGRGGRGTGGVECWDPVAPIESAVIRLYSDYAHEDTPHSRERLLFVNLHVTGPDGRGPTPASRSAAPGPHGH